MVGLLWLLAVVGWGLSGWPGVAAVAVAGGICWASGSVALLASHACRQPDHFLLGVLLGMLTRMGVPLAFGLVIHLRRGPLTEAGFLYYLLVFYLCVLAVETVLSLPPETTIQDNSPPKPKRLEATEPLKSPKSTI